MAGLAGWLLGRLGRRQRASRLELLDRISLAPRQQVALIEVEGRRLLVATSPESTPAFYALDGGETQAAKPMRAEGRVSW